jgi:hypothetical protein
MKHDKPQLTKVIKAMQTKQTNNVIPFAPTLTKLATPLTKFSDYPFMHKRRSVFSMIMDQDAERDIPLKLFDEHGYLFRVSMKRTPRNEPKRFNVYVAKIPMEKDNTRSRDRMSKLVYHRRNAANLSTTNLCSMADVQKVIDATLAALRHHTR